MLSVRFHLKILENKDMAYCVRITEIQLNPATRTARREALLLLYWHIINYEFMSYIQLSGTSITIT